MAEQIAIRMAEETPVKGNFDSPDDQPYGQGCYNATRLQQATRLNTWINSTVIPTSGDSDVILIGDFNSYALENPITTLTGLGYTNLSNYFEGTYAYSYGFDAQSGYLDHALTHPSLTPQVTGAADWHIDADEPDVLDYDTSFKPPSQDALYEPNAYRTSDHDPVVVGLNVVNYPPELGVSQWFPTLLP